MKIFFILLVCFFTCPFYVLADTQSNDFQIKSPAFDDNALIPAKYTCDGANVNPPITFSHIPAEARSLALTVSDPDAPSGTWSHWVVYNIPPDTAEVLENSSPGIEGINDFGKAAYGGPCPPGGKLHHYIFRAYALDTALTINNTPTFYEIEKEVQGHLVAKSEWIGTYQK